MSATANTATTQPYRHGDRDRRRPHAPVTVTQAGQGGTGGTCANPVTFTRQHRQLQHRRRGLLSHQPDINGWGCYNFEGRTLTVGGVARTCGQMPLTRNADGYYYFAATAGQYPWAGIYAW